MRASARAPVAQPPRRAVPGRKLPAMGGGATAAAAAAPRPPSPNSTRRRSPRPWHARPTSAPAERASGGVRGGTEPAQRPGEPKATGLQPQDAQQPAHGPRRPVSAPQFRRGRAVSVAPQQPDRSNLKTPADGMNRPKTPAAPTKTAGQPRPDSALDTAQQQQPAAVPRSFPAPSGANDGLGAAMLDFQAADFQPDRSDLKTPLDGMSRPSSSLGRNAPTKTPPAADALESLVLGPMDSHAELPLPFAMESLDCTDAGASHSIWEPSPRTMDELDAEVMQVTGVSGDGPCATAQASRATVQPERTAVTRPNSAPQIPRPSSAKSGAFVERPKSSLGHSGSAAANSSAVTPRRLAALQQEVRQMKAERINPTPTKSHKLQASQINPGVAVEAVAQKPEPSSRPFKKRPARPATKTKSLKQPIGLTVQVDSPSGEPGINCELSTSTHQDAEAGDTTPATTTVGDGTPARVSVVTPEDSLSSLRSESVADLWAAEDAAGTDNSSSSVPLAKPPSKGPIVVVDSKSTADALQDMLRRVDDLSARLTTSEREKMELSAKVTLLEGSSPFQFDKENSLVQNQLVELEMEKMHLDSTTDGLRCLMDNVESTWREKYCKLASQSMLRGSALKQLQGQNSTAAVTSDNVVCGKCGSAEEEAREWREKAHLMEAELKSAQSSEATARKQMAAAVSSSEKIQEEHELTVSSLRAQAANALEQERATVAKLTDQLRSERKAASEQLRTAKTQSESLCEVQHAEQTAQAELQEERAKSHQLQQQVATMDRQISQLQFRLSANETELLQNEHERQQRQETVAKTEAELARSTQVSSAATLRIQELESEVQAARDAADAAAISSAATSPREIALSAAQAGDAIVIQHLRDEATQLRARLIATEVGAQEVAEEKLIEIKQLRTQLSKLQTNRESASEPKREEKSATAIATHQQQQHQQQQQRPDASLLENVELSIAMSTQTAKDVADHTNQLVELAASVEEIRELIDHGTDTAIDLHGHVGLLQELVVGQQQETANLRMEQAATTMATAHQKQLMLSQPPAGAAREAVRAKQSDATHPAFSPLPSPAAPSVLVDTGPDNPTTSSKSTSSERERTNSDNNSRTSQRSGPHGLRQRSRNGNSTRDKQDSMRNALRQLKRELSKVQDSQVTGAALKTNAKDESAAQLRKESSGGYSQTAAHSQQGVRNTITIGSALAAATSSSAATRDRRPAKLSTISDVEKTASQSLLHIR
jgi:hypothetical protein